jgi:hypothetical protein
MLWDLAEGKRLYSLDAGDVIHSLVFSPNRYWLCAATSTSVCVLRVRAFSGGGSGCGWAKTADKTPFSRRAGRRRTVYTTTIN